MMIDDGDFDYLKFVPSSNVIYPDRMRIFEMPTVSGCYIRQYLSNWEGIFYLANYWCE